MSYLNWFQQLTKHQVPHAWQVSLGESHTPENRLIRIPTGMGKTQGVLVAWAYNRIHRSDESWPRRVIWCLPMRTLVEQTVAVAKRLFAALDEDLRPNVYMAMGGNNDETWIAEPERNSVIVGTQDMLLSRALNRGYAMKGRAAWPRAFGLINSDALWVMDEIQLMGVGLRTSGQIQAFADMQPTQEGARPRATWWMSATLQPDWLQSPELSIDELKANMLSVQKVDRIGPQWAAEKNVIYQKAQIADWPDLIVNRHFSHSSSAEYGRQTLVVVNRVKTAVELHKVVANQLSTSEDSVTVRLIHSRFRPADRESWANEFLSRETLGPEVNRIIIATQVVEAGVDISCSNLVTELAPWPCLVQRFGRAARYGGTSDILVLDQGYDDDKKAAPYQLAELKAARNAIRELSGGAIGELEDYEQNLPDERLETLYPYDPVHVLLHEEFRELFDTSPDLSGGDIDISRYLREGEDRDVQIFWRALDGKPAPDIQPQRRELCSVPLGDARNWLNKLRKNGEKSWTWNYLDGEWLETEFDRLRPGLVLLVSTTAGGYSSELGFTGSKPSTVVEVSELATPDISDRMDENEDTSTAAVWKTICTHCRDAANEVDNLVECFKLGDESIARVLNLTMRLHDWGKAHPAFATGTYLVEPERGDLAKAPKWRSKIRLYRTDTHGPRRGFRHELASMLGIIELLRGTNPDHPAIFGTYRMMLEACDIPMDDSLGNWQKNPVAREVAALSEMEVNLLLYLVVAHHGKVRMSLQATPLDQEFPFDEKSYVGTGMPIRGVREHDTLPAVTLPIVESDTEMPELGISLQLAAMGLSGKFGASWSERTQTLLNSYGPFYLGWLEAIVRTADGRASDDSTPPGNVPDPLLSGVVLGIPGVGASGLEEELHV